MDPLNPLAPMQVAQALAGNRVPLPRPDPRGTDFTQRAVPPAQWPTPIGQPGADMITPDMLLAHRGIVPNPDALNVKPDDIMRAQVALPASYGAGRYKLYTPTARANMATPPDAIARLIEAIQKAGKPGNGLQRFLK